MLSISISYVIRIPEFDSNVDLLKSLVRKYFESSNIPHSQDILVLHLLRRCRYVEALQLYKKNKKITIMVGTLFSLGLKQFFFSE